MSSNKRRLSKDITGLPKKTRHDVSAVSTTNTVRCLHILLQCTFQWEWWDLNQSNHNTNHSKENIIMIKWEYSK